MAEKLPEPPDPFWASWADMITIFFIFFVFLFSMSTLDVEKFAQVSKSVNEEMSKRTGEETELMEKLKVQKKTLEGMQTQLNSYIQQENLKDVVQVDSFDDRLELRLGNVLLFNPGEIQLKPKAMEVLSKIGNVFKQTRAKIVVEGHTDDIPIKTPAFPSNWELSAARAATVVQYMGTVGVKEDQFQVIGYAHYQPLAPNTNDANRAKNRRVRIILKPDIEAILKKQEKAALEKEESANQIQHVKQGDTAREPAHAPAPAGKVTHEPE